MSTTLYLSNGKLFGVVAANGITPEGGFFCVHPGGKREEFNTPGRLMLAMPPVRLGLEEGESGRGLQCLRFMAVLLELNSRENPAGKNITDETGYSVPLIDILAQIGTKLDVSNYLLPG